ncbi:MAG: magnesium transporter, partial [Clostridia bacterium]|nr:magnesium transporter [Clostridia bacterium]
MEKRTDVISFENPEDFFIGFFIVSPTVLGVALITTVLIAKVLGCLLPMGAKLLHLDPALMAGPLV